MIPGSANPLLLKSAAAAGPVQIERSLRFNSSDSAFLSRTPASAGNRKTFTFAFWYKRSNISTSVEQAVFTTNTTYDGIRFENNTDKLRFFLNGAASADLTTTQVFRDASAWYHFVISVDTTQSTASNRVKIYVNGSQITTFDTATYPAQNYDCSYNSTNQHVIGYSPTAGTHYLNGYLADIYFIDGQALTPSSFTEVSATTGQLIPKAYTGSFGTNGFWLKFSDNSAATATTLGKDYSGNSNNWTPNNLSVTAGAGNDSLVDTPTSYGTDTGAGGEVRGNYAVINSVSTALTISDGNLKWTGAGSTPKNAQVSIALPSGKWYWEFVTVNNTGGGGNLGCGISTNLTMPSTVEPGNNSYGYELVTSGSSSTMYKNNNSSFASFSTYAAGNVWGIAIDIDAGKMWFSKNGTWVSGGNPSAGTTPDFTGIAAPVIPYVYGYNTSDVGTINFGQQAFTYTAPSGFKALCDTNLPAPVVAKPNTVMDAILYSGNSSTQSITSLAFSPDLVWSKCRNVVRSHRLSDAVRGSNRDIYPDVYYSEGADGSITAFTANGFNLDNSTGSQYNTSGETYVSWCWDAGSSTVSNTSGSITSSVRANASAGFSVVGWNYPNGTGASTIGHGLGVKPGMIILKNRDAGTNWIIYHSSIGATKCFRFTTAAASTESDPWNNTEPTSTVFSIGAASWHGAGNIIAYCFAPVAGYSSGFSYTGNGSTDGVFVYLGLRAKLLLIKRTDTTGNWYLWDTVRNTYNVVGEELYPNLSNAAATATDLDILSNGFKMRSTAADFNASGGTYVGFAWAESPFQYSRAR